MPVLQSEDIDKLTSILSNQAASAPFNLGANGYYRGLIQKSNLPVKQKNSRIGGLTGDPDFDARELLLWADVQGSNPIDLRYTTLGALLEKLLPDLGGEDSQRVAATILARGLYRDPALVIGLQRDYQIPLKANAAPTSGAAKNTGFPEELGPDLEWQGPQSELELQSFLKPEPNFQDVGFLMRAIQRAACVCRIVFEGGSRIGTGFIVGKNRVLTNFHVMVDTTTSQMDPSNEIQANGLQARLQFGILSTPSGDETPGQQFVLDRGKPVLKWSPVQALDYALLQVEESLAYHDELPVAPLDEQNPAVGEALNILQHPGGTALQLALSGDGIVAVIPEKGRVQYSTRSLGGSSGAPCFNDDWQVVALHHAQRSRHFGVVREGILINNILEEIQTYLS